MQHRRKAENLRKKTEKEKERQKEEETIGCHWIVFLFDEHCATFRESNAIFANLTGIELTLQ